MSHSIPDSQTIAGIWQAVKDRSIPLKGLTKTEYDVLDEVQKNANVAYLVQSLDGLSFIYKGETLITPSDYVTVEQVTDLIDQAISGAIEEAY